MKGNIFMNTIFLYTNIDDSMEISAKIFSSHQKALEYLSTSVSEYLNILNESDYNFQNSQNLLKYLNTFKKINFTGNKNFGDASIYSNKGSNKDLTVSFVDFIEEDPQIYSIKELTIE